MTALVLFSFAVVNRVHDLLCENPEIPPTGVGGLFRSNLHASTNRVLESHPREWGGLFRSGLHASTNRVLESTHGSGWIVQIRPSKQSGRVQSRASSASCALYVS